MSHPESCLVPSSLTPHLGRCWVVCFAALVAACGGGQDDTAAESNADSSLSVTDPATSGFASDLESAQAVVAGWVKVASENQVFTLRVAQTVRYGTGAAWVQKALPVGPHYCANWIFGDPAPGLAKQCQVPSAAPAPAPTPAPAPAPAPVATTCNLPNFTQELLDRVNQFRASARTCGTVAYAAAPPLVWNGPLTQAAAGHSLDMATNNHFSHTSFDGRTMVDRVNAAGYAWSALGENIAAGQGTVAAVMSSWQGSAGHCANLMNPSFNHIGAACVPQPAGSTGGYGRYWTMNLGRPR